MKNKNTLLCFFLTCMIMCTTAVGKTKVKPANWTATWATAPEYTGEGDMPKSSLSNRSIRQIVHVSVGGRYLRLKLSNEFSTEPVEIKSVYIADAKDSCDVDIHTAKYLKFGKKKNITITAKGCAVSDCLEYNLKPSQTLAVTICYGEKTPEHATSHRGSRTTSYIIEGEATTKSSFAVSERLEHWYNISAIDVLSDTANSIAILGNSITDGRGSITDKQNRWTDIFSNTLLAKGTNYGVLNLGIGGNSVYYGGLSEPGYKRFDRDILGQSGVKYVIIFEGVNDIGPAEGDTEARCRQLINCYKEMVSKCRKRDIKVIGCTIMPFRKSFYDDGGFFKEAARNTLNSWIRQEGSFDAVIDFDMLMRNPKHYDELIEALQEDWLHPNAAGYKIMGEFAAKQFLKITDYGNKQ